MALAIGTPLMHAQQAAGAKMIPVPQQAADSGQNASSSESLAEFQQLEDKWADAVLNKDQYELELIIAPSFVGIDGSGAVTDRNEEIARLFVKSLAKQTIEFKAVSARSLGDAVVVNGTYILHLSKDASDPKSTEKGVFTHVFQRSKSGWLCINAQRTIVSNPAGSDGKPQARK